MTDAGTPPSGLQKINVKLFLDAPPDLDHDVLLEIFGRWRLEEGQDIIDLADYAHVDDGPGCLLISHSWHFGIDQGGGRPGLFYSTRKGLSGTLADRFRQALRGLIEKSLRLLAEKEFPRGVKPHPGELEVILNDRLQFPNTDSSDAAARPELERVIEKLYGAGGFRLERDGHPAHRLGYKVVAPAADGLRLEDLAARL